MAQKEIWKVIITKPAVKVYDKAPKAIKLKIDVCFEDLEQNPFYGINIRRLTGQLKGLYRYRVGDWRIIYRLISEKKIVEVIAILPRGDFKKQF